MPTKKASESPPAGFTLGSQVEISHWHGGELVLDTNQRIRCFLGYRREDQPRDLPWFSPSVALRDRDGRGSYRFVELHGGVLSQSGFLRPDEYYKIIDDRFLDLPRGAVSYFGVVRKGDREEDEELTRQVFGGTMEELEAVAHALAGIVGRSFHEMVRLPRLTFSKTRENYCDISGCLIPREFPYVAFDSAQYDWSHVSLYGLFRLVSFMCPSDGRGPVGAALERAGISTELVRRLVDSGTNARPLYPRELDL
jgi:hypothetical protein